jgi:hypothetical protein
MTGQAHWLTLAFIAGGAAALLLMLWLEGRASRAGRGKHYLSRTIECPKKHLMVDATFIQDNKTGAVDDVVRCTAFDDPERVTCRKYCGDELNELTPRGG